MGSTVFERVCVCEAVVCLTMPQLIQRNQAYGLMYKNIHTTNRKSLETRKEYKLSKACQFTIKSSIYCCSALSLASISLILKLPSLINESSIVRFESPLSLSPYLLCKSKLSSSEVAINGSGVEERFLPLRGRFDDFVLCLNYEYQW